MFNEKKATGPVEQARNVIGANTIIKGSIKSEGDFRVDGEIEGDITTSGRVVIGKSGKVKGSIVCDNADFQGSFEGQLKVEETLSLSSSAIVQGEAVIGKLSIEPGAQFNVTCKMKDSGVKDLSGKIEKTA